MASQPGRLLTERGLIESSQQILRPFVDLDVPGGAKIVFGEAAAQEPYGL
jgi:hypothetical protein